MSTFPREVLDLTSRLALSHSAREMEDLQQVITTTASTLETMADGLLARSALLGKMAEACKAMGNAFPAKPVAQAQPRAALETNGTSKKRGRPKRDPAAPVKPMSAFMRYLTAVRKTKEFTEMAGTSKEKLAAVASMWKVLPQQYKQGYIQQERQEIQVYKVALDTYRKQQQPPSLGTAPSKGKTATTPAYGQPDEELPPTQDENENFSEEDEPTEEQRGGRAHSSSRSSAVAQAAGQREDGADVETEGEEDEEDGFVRRGKGSQGKKQKKEKKETKRPKRKHSTDSL